MQALVDYLSFLNGVGMQNRMISYPLRVEKTDTMTKHSTNELGPLLR